MLKHLFLIGLDIEKDFSGKLIKELIIDSGGSKGRNYIRSL